MPFERFICPECGSSRLKVSLATPSCYYCALCAYVVRDELGRTIVTEEGLRSWVLGAQAPSADIQQAPHAGIASIAPTSARSKLQPPVAH
jgi:hypothetical protein